MLGTSIHRYRLREGSEPPQKLFKELNESVCLEIDWRNRNDVDWLSDTADFDFLIVLDEDFCQPYTPFYGWMSGGSRPSNEWQQKVADEYNKFMDSRDWLVRDESLEVSWDEEDMQEMPERDGIEDI